jgi:lipid-A-disaccharide synthase-like uncharacterized protein
MLRKRPFIFMDRCFGTCIMLNYYVCQKLNYLIICYNTSFYVYVQILFLVGEAEHVKYLVEIE